ncbi:hypothetical protein [Pseudomonas viridiflava]|uniref:hypothetical protein n=1 Tax=Pseudomonas viridiflava TaxID=33069 RepID=UPI000F01D4C2|nr:hypothetical protein [Pseudomonas viridiflava]
MSNELKKCSVLKDANVSYAASTAVNAAALGAQNVNSAMSTIDALRQQLADVSNERDGFRVQVEEAERFVEYLINNCVGQVVSEGKIKYWMACSIERHAKEKSTEQRAQS